MPIQLHVYRTIWSWNLLVTRHKNKVSESEVWKLEICFFKNTFKQLCLGSVKQRDVYARPTQGVYY